MEGGGLRRSLLTNLHQTHSSDASCQPLSASRLALESRFTVLRRTSPVEGERLPKARRQLR